jgi:hypothetical protein
MTRSPDAHLSLDEIDSCLAGFVALDVQRHLGGCPGCMEQLRSEREVVDQIAALPLMAPSEGFADRVMASVNVSDPFAIRSLQATRRRWLATPGTLAHAAGILLVLAVSMAGSVVWSLTHQQTLAAIGTWFLAQGGEALWLSVQGIASTIIEQPWYGALRELAANPGRLALYSGLLSCLYLGGILALRRLLTVPAQQVAHASI